VCHSSLPAAVSLRSSPRCCDEFSVNTSLESLIQSHVALMRKQLLQLVDIRMEEASRPLRDEVAALKLLLAHVGDSLEPTEACTFGDLGLAPAQASLLLDSTEHKSSMVEEEHLHGCFSPRGSPCTLPQPTFESDGVLESWLRCCRSHHSLMSCVGNLLWWQCP
jgi:hypothetical protein